MPAGKGSRRSPTQVAMALVMDADEQKRMKKQINPII